MSKEFTTVLSLFEVYKELGIVMSPEEHWKIKPVSHMLDNNRMICRYEYNNRVFEEIIKFDEVDDDIVEYAYFKIYKEDDNNG